MSVAKINAITVPSDRVEEFVARFAARSASVASSPGFEAFELLAPNDDRGVFLVYTRWASEDDFQAWVQSPAFAHGHRGQYRRPCLDPLRALVIRRRHYRGSDTSLSA